MNAFVAQRIKCSLELLPTDFEFPKNTVRIADFHLSHLSRKKHERAGRAQESAHFF
jgi:hypothetical protein